MPGKHIFKGRQNNPLHLLPESFFLLLFILSLEMKFNCSLVSVESSGSFRFIVNTESSSFCLSWLTWFQDLQMIFEIEPNIRVLSYFLPHWVQICHYKLVCLFSVETFPKWINWFIRNLIEFLNRIGYLEKERIEICLGLRLSYFWKWLLVKFMGSKNLAIHVGLLICFLYPLCTG